MYRDGDDPSEVIANLRHRRPAAEFREKLYYSNNNYLALAHSVSVITGTPYQKWIHENIFKPLDMSSATNNSHDAAKSGHRTDAFVHAGRDRTTRDSIGEAKNVGWWTTTDGMWHIGGSGIAMSITDSVSPASIVDSDASAQGKWVRELLSPRHFAPELVTKYNEGHIPLKGDL